MSVALITGGATGIGRGFANKLADQGYNLILTSRNLENLALAQKEIQNKYHVKVLIYVADITNESARKSLYEYVENYPVSIVVNNAGIGYSQNFYEGDITKEQELIDLNITAMQAIFKYYTKKFYDLKEGRIINVSSVAGFVPGPGAATYYASKAYVTSLTRAVALETKHIKGLKIQAVCPGPTKSNFYLTSGTSKKYYKANPDKVAQKTLESKKTIVLPGFKNKMLHVLLKLFPTALTSRINYRIQKNMRKKA